MGKKLAPESFDKINEIIKRVYESKERGVWIEELSREVNVSQSTIRYWVNHKQDLMQGIKLVPLGEIGKDRKGQETKGKPHMVVLVASRYLKNEPSPPNLRTDSSPPAD